MVGYFVLNLALTSGFVRYKLGNQMIEEEKMSVLNRLVMKSGPDAGKTYTLDKEEYVMGRELINDLIINDPEISRKHARLILKKNKYYLEDLGSTNGTFLAGKRISKAMVLKNGDLIKLGKSVELEFIAEEEVKEKIEPAVDEKKEEGTKEIKKAPAEKKPVKTTKPARVKKDKVKSTAPFGIEKLRNTPTWVVVLVIVLLFLLVFCVIPLTIIEVTNQWCNFFGTFFNQIQPGVCP